MKRATCASFCIPPSAGACTSPGRWPWPIALPLRWASTRRRWPPTTASCCACPPPRTPCQEAICSVSIPTSWNPSCANAWGSRPCFAARFRECAARALLMSPTAPGKRAPLWQQRLKGGQLLEAARREEDFPIVLEALRECLQDVFDLPALREVMDGLASGSIKMSEVAHGRPVAVRGAARVRVFGRAPLRGRSAPCRAAGVASVRGSDASGRASGHRCCGRYAGYRGGGAHRGRAAADGRWLEGAGRGRRGRSSARAGAAYGGGDCRSNRGRRSPPSFSRTWKPPIALSPPSSAARRGGLPLMMARV